MKHDHGKMSQGQWDEYRLRRLAIQRQAVRRVKYTLLAVAMLAGCWFLFLLWKDARESQYTPARLETIAPAQNENPLPLKKQPMPTSPAMSTTVTLPVSQPNKTEDVPGKTVPAPTEPRSGPIKPPETANDRKTPQN